MIDRSRRVRPVLIAAAAASVAAVATATALLPGVLRPGAQSGPTASTGTTASVLRQLADAAAGQPTPALGPVLYAKDALWGPGSGNLRDADVQRVWESAAASYFVAGKVAGYTKLDPRHNPYWNWRNPATLPTGEAALRRHLLAAPGDHSDKPILRPPTTPDESVFNAAVQLMTSEPLRPATRASMLRLIAAIARRAPHEFVILGSVTDRGGYRDLAVAAQSNEAWRYSSRLHTWKLVRTRSTELIVYLFDPASGVIRAQERALCRGPVHSVAVAGARCAIASYEQYLTVAARPLPKGASARKSPYAPYAFLPWQLIIP